MFQHKRAGLYRSGRVEWARLFWRTTAERVQRRGDETEGVGKLAPFGVCRFIEVISSRGDRIGAPGGGRGFRTAHLILDPVQTADGLAVERIPRRDYH